MKLWCSADKTSSNFERKRSVVIGVFIPDMKTEHSAFALAVGLMGGVARVPGGTGNVFF